MDQLVQALYFGDGVIVEPECYKIMILRNSFGDDFGKPFVLKI